MILTTRNGIKAKISCYANLHRSGLDFGDQILNINGVDVAGMGPSAVQSMLNYGDKVWTNPRC